MTNFVVLRTIYDNLRYDNLTNDGGKKFKKIKARKKCVLRKQLKVKNYETSLEPRRTKIIKKRGDFQRSLRERQQKLVI